MTRRELERIIDERVRARTAALERRLDELVSELRDDLHAELAALDDRVTGTHRHALRALTKTLERK